MMDLLCCDDVMGRPRSQGAPLPCFSVDSSSSLLQKAREALLFGGVLPIRRIRGWVGAEPIRPRASARGYMRALLRSSIRMACRGRLAGLPTPTAASQLSPNPRHCNGERAYLFGMKRLQKSAEESFPGMATKGTKTQKGLSDRQDSKSSHSFCAFCAFCGECRSYQPFTFAASMSFPIGNFAKGSIASSRQPSDSRRPGRTGSPSVAATIGSRGARLAREPVRRFHCPIRGFPAARPPGGRPGRPFGSR